jgi:GTP-binding protein Era
MVHAAWSGVTDSDVTLHVVDAPGHLRVLSGEPTAQDKRAFNDTERVTAGLKKREEKNAFLVLNKIDEIAHDRLLEVIASFTDKEIYREVFMISALNLDGVSAMQLAMAEVMPKSPFLFPPDQAADIPSRLMAAEITREKLFLRLHDELPYASTVETEKWTRQKNGDVRIDQIIYVKRESQKPIVLGRCGSASRYAGVARLQSAPFPLCESP